MRTDKTSRHQDINRLQSFMFVAVTMIILNDCQSTFASSDPADLNTIVLITDGISIK